MFVIRILFCDQYYRLRILRKCSLNCVLATALMLTILTLLHSSDSSRPLVLFVNATNITDTSCYYKDDNDQLPLLDKAQFSPPRQSIFFHEVSCKGGLDSRQACSVEAAARNNPNWQIYILFTGPVNKTIIKNGNLSTLKTLKNVHIFRIHANKFSTGTIFERNFKGKKLKTFTIYQISDALKYLTLKQWGGVVMDMDMMTLKSFDKYLPNNFAAKVSHAVIGDGIIAISKDGIGRNISKETMHLLQNVRQENFHKIITRALKKTCEDVAVYHMHSGNCDGFEVFPSSSFYPIGFDEWQRYYRERDILVTGYPDDVFTHCMWNKMSGQLKIPNNSLYADLARMCCPTIYELYGDHFGY